MEIMTNFTRSKFNTIDKNGDFTYIGNNIVAVIDSVTPKHSEVYSCSILNHFSDVDNLISANNLELSTVPEYLTAKFRELENVAAYTFSMYSSKSNSVLVVGDCGCTVELPHGSLTKISGHGSPYENELICVRNLENTLQFVRGTSLDDIILNDYGRKLIMPILEKESLISNSTLCNSYAVINGVNIPEEFITIEQVMNEARALILHSDGYKKVLPSFDETEEYLKSSVKDILNIPYLKMPCPYCDDRSYVRINLI